MPLGTCDPASRGQAYNGVTLEVPLPDGSGSVLIDCHFGWDGVSVRPDCNGPTQSIWTRNTGAMTAWVLLPNRRKSPPYAPIAPGADVTITAQGQITNYGLTSYTDVRDLWFQFTDPSVQGLMSGGPVQARVIARP